MNIGAACITQPPTAGALRPRPAASLSLQRQTTDIVGSGSARLPRVVTESRAVHDLLAWGLVPGCESCGLGALHGTRELNT
jgi:hypothetical protein